MFAFEGVCNVEGVVFVDVSVSVRGERVEDVRLKRVGWLHYEGVQIQPPEPLGLGVLSKTITTVTS